MGGIGLSRAPIPFRLIQKSFQFLSGVSVSFGSRCLQRRRRGKGSLLSRAFKPLCNYTTKKISGEQSGEDCILPEKILYFLRPGSQIDRDRGTLSQNSPVLSPQLPFS